MADQKTVDEWPEEEAPGTASRKTPRGLRPRAARGLQLQQIDEPDGGDIYAGIGTELRAERQRRQLSIIDVSTTLRIQQSHLSALEEGRTDDLPGPTYAIGFLRTYAEFLGLDGEEIIRQYKREETLTPGARRLIFPEPVEEARRPGLTLALILLIVAGAVYGGWIFLERRGLLPIEIVSEPPQRLAPYQTAAKSPTPPDTTQATSPTFKRTATEVAPTVNPAGPQVKMSERPETGSGEAVKKVAAVGTAETAAPTLTETAREGTAEKAIADRAEQGEGERAAAADVIGLANTNDKTIKVSAKTSPETRVVEALPANPAHQNPNVSNENPVTTAAAEKMPRPAEIKVAAAPPAVVQPAVARPSALPDTSPVPPPIQHGREGSDVDTAPTMPAIQAAIAPPPPPAAPAAPTRPVAEGGGDAAASGDEGRASLATAAESLGYRPQAYGAANRDVRVVLRARAASWVQVQGANNELLLTRMLRPGDSYHAPNRTDLVLMTGNAGAIEIMVDGETLGTLGPIGQVRRNIKLNADHLRGELQPPGNEQ